MDVRYYIGIDVSKATLDWAVLDGTSIVLQTQSPNSETGTKAALKLIKALSDFKAQTSVSCCEHTARRPQVFIECHRWRWSSTIFSISFH